MARLTFSITVDDAHLDRTQLIADEIGRSGMSVDRVVPMAGAIRATGDEATLNTIRKIDGVMKISPETRYDLPPMDPKIPQ